jgi:general secretion pathway protein L
MRLIRETDVTASPGPDPSVARASGVWTLAGNALIIASPEGPATLLVPTESVRLLTVDLPLNSRAKRLEALPYAIEDQIAEPLEAVHIALGAEISPKRYLVGVVRHEVMEAWTARTDEAGLGHAAMVPDALALPRPAEGAWSVDLSANRAVVRSGDGTGFAAPATMLRPAWESAGNPPATAYGAPLPADMMMGQGVLDPTPLATRLLAPALDLRQGRYARRSTVSNVWRRVAWVVAIGAAAHALIALADTMMLRTIADRRAEETRQLVALAAPGTNLSGDVAATVANMLPQGGGGGPQVFVPLASRVFAALSGAGSVNAQAMDFQAGTLTLDFAAEPGLAARIRTALANGRVNAQVAEGADGTIRVTAKP